MRKAKRVNQKRKQVAREVTSGLNAASRSVGEFNNGFREIADEMNEYSIRSLENVFRTWQQFLDAGPLRQVFEFQARYAQNAQNAYEAYVGEISRLGEMYLDVTRRVSKPRTQGRRRAG